MSETVPPTRRALVRDVVAATLDAGVPMVRGRVFRARTWPLQREHFPALLVYGYDETKTLTNMSRGEASYDVTCTMAVGLRVQEKSIDTPGTEADLEALAGAVCLSVMTAPALRLSRRGGGLDVSIGAARTTLGIKTDGETAIGEGVIAFEMAWQEQYALPPPELCEEFSLALLLTPSVP
ncbi:hypothetical protein [Roseomonas indoligenes]|uniref:Uncharacterized protein n=1 Tax=Roseomonas indoligenes TaxID=2820811 RepID=A0A940MUE9_9PROT|nr:hypothetical protein [Pararoseomonas indoligenes]MBP0492171.1 hypothetical protein [Pararoseomonas indoligenes]